MGKLSLSIPKQFGKTALAEQIQTFVIEAMAQAWDEGYAEAETFDPHPWSEVVVPQNPYREK